MKVLTSAPLFKKVVLYYVATQVTASCLFPEVIQKINNYGRIHYKKEGSALLTESESLSKIAKQYLENKERQWNNLDANGSRMVLWRKYSKLNKADTVEVALLAVVQKMSEYIGLEPRHYSQSENENITITTDSGDVVYEKPKFINSGSQGKLFVGKQSGSHDPVAIKKGIRVELQREAGCYTAIKKHPGLLKLLNHGVSATNQEKYVLVLELMFTDMFDLLLLCGNKFSLKTSILVIQQLLEAVEHIHNNNYVHQDLKLENIMMSTSDFKNYVFKIGDLGLAEKFSKAEINGSQTTRKRLGSPLTMSTFTHDMEPASPRIDIMSIWFFFGKIVFGSLPWSNLCDEIDEILNEHDREGTEVTAQSIKKINALFEKIYNLKTAWGKELAANYPDLLQFANHVYALKLNDKPDYDMLNRCLTRLMENQRVVDDGKFDWDIKLRMLLQDPDVLRVGIAHRCYTNGFEFIFIFEKFYATITRQIEEKGNVVEVLDRLNKEAKLVLSDSETSNPKNVFRLEVSEDALDDILLGNFNNSEVITTIIRTNPLVFAGFAYYYNAGVYNVVMILHMILSPEICISVPLSKAMMIEATQYLYSTPTPHDKSNEKPLQQELNPFIWKLSLDYPLGDVLHETLKETLGQVKPFAETEPHLIEFGYAWRQFEAGGQKKVEIVYVFRRIFDFSKSFSDETKAKGLTKFSWSVDESPYQDNVNSVEKTYASSSSSSSSGKDRIQPMTSSSQLASKSEWISSKVFQIVTNCPNSAANEAIQKTLERKEIEDGPYNVRVHLKRNSIGNMYTVAVVKDSYYSLVKATYEKLIEPITYARDESYWKLEDHKPRIIQMANSMAYKKNFLENKVLPLHNEEGFLFYVTRIPFVSGFTVDQMIQSTVMFLINNNEELKNYNPRYISSVSFGYAITVSGAVKGVLTLETYCFEALFIINEARVKLGLKELLLDSKNYELAELYRSQYVGWKGYITPACTSSEVKMPLTKESFIDQTAKEVLSTVVRRCLAKGKGQKYDMITSEIATEISFAVFQSKVGGKWKINIKVH